MNQRLVWNFEFVPATLVLPKDLLAQESDSIKWEARFFWPHDEIIVLNTIDSSLLNLANYQQKYREDYYYLLANKEYNIKRRRHELLYKPLIKQTPYATGFGSKIKLETLPKNTHEPNADYLHLHQIAQKVAEEGREIHVKKIAFIYKFATTPTIKLELAHLEVEQHNYFSLCIEGKSLRLVEQIAEQLLGKRISCDYVTFLKNLLP